jgi:hypothetical protein
VRARRELLATGEIVRRRTVEMVDEFTAQIARLASDRLTIAEISTSSSSAAHGRVAPAQGVRKARHRPPQAAPRALPDLRTRGPA